MHINTLDLEDFQSDNPRRQERFLEGLVRQCDISSPERTGFVGLANHGFNRDLLRNLFEAMDAFFALPKEVKMETHDPHLKMERGYEPLGSEVAVGGQQPDHKEFISVGFEYDKPNRFPGEVPELERHGIEVRDGFYDISQVMCRALGEALMPSQPDIWYHACKEGGHLLRLQHYLKNAPEGAWWGGAHSDISLLTLLAKRPGVAQSKYTDAGLQIQLPQGEWVSADFDPGILVMNIGQTFERLSNGRFPSTPHRVKANPDKERMAMPYFHHPNDQTTLGPHPDCITPEHPRQYVAMPRPAFFDLCIAETQAASGAYDPRAEFVRRWPQFTQEFGHAYAKRSNETLLRKLHPEEV